MINKLKNDNTCLLYLQTKTWDYIIKYLWISNKKEVFLMNLKNKLIKEDKANKDKIK